MMYFHNIPPYSKKNDTRTFLKRNWTVLDYELRILEIVGSDWRLWYSYEVPSWILSGLLMWDYSWMSWLVVNNCLLLTVNNSIEYIYWEYRVSICMLLKVSLQESLGPALVIILLNFFCSMNTSLTTFCNSSFVSGCTLPWKL
jgi:hypothetical protein